MATVHPLAVVHPDAKLAADVVVGPFCTVAAGVTIGAGTKLISHVVVDGETHIGERNTFYPFASIGLAPQDKKYANEPTRLVIGNDNVFRESCTIHRGTIQDRSVTTLGSRILVMAYAHVAHDCTVGDDVILANNATLAGHVTVGEFAILGGLSGVHQFCRVGAHAMVGGCACVTQDVAPYVLGHGNPFSVSGVNSEGLKRRGFSADAVSAVRAAHKTIWRSGLVLKEAVAEIEATEAVASPDVQNALRPLLEFLRVSGRGLAR
ncbi:MAG: acyl-ACP--UDP-N-acetylglucosamine O-acyltransferase [Betaproteobacteria bacterium]|nr:MAG: acyl-ACP--UDP-N-acetylglucosamine O-acyltransferase [Betaproteobacteria bacterium]